MTVLVAYGTKNGSTAEIAGWIAEELRAAGLDARTAAAGEVADVSGYEALILGGAIYAGGWHTDARRFAKRFASRSRSDGLPVWLFSSGPLEHIADGTDLPPSHQAEVAMRRLKARGHVTFGGRMTVEAHGWLGFVARRLEKEGHATGDFRDRERVRAWARDVAAQILAPRVS